MAISKMLTLPVAHAVIIGVLLTGTACQPNQTEPSAPATPSARAEPYATPEPTITTEPEPPEESSQQTAKGAIAFIEHYRQLYEYGTATANWKPLKQATNDSCRPCTQLWNPPGHLQTRGGQPLLITYGDEDSVELSLMADDPFVTAWIKSPAGRWHPADERNARMVSRENWGARFYLEWKDDSWSVRDLEIRELSEGRELDYIW